MVMLRKIKLILWQNKGVARHVGGEGKVDVRGSRHWREKSREKDL